MDAPVIIVGGGPVGFSLALGLARHGVRSILLDKEPQPATQSRALILWPRTLEHMADWAVAEELSAAGTFQPTLTVCDARGGKPLLSIDFGLLNETLDRAGAVIVPQYDTERVLRERVAATGLCDVRTNCEAIGIEQDDDSVRVRTRTGILEGTLRAAFAAGCDGAHGMVRGALGLSLEGVTYGVRAVLSDDVLTDDRPGPMVRFALDRPGLLFGVRFAPKTWRVVAFVPPTMDDDTALSDPVHAERLRTVLDGKFRTQTVWKSLFQLHRRRARHFVVGRIALAGDAAHLVSPAGGEGMNAGIQDAANLAWKLAYAAQERGDARLLLASYEAERPQMIADTVDRFSDRMTRFVTRTPPWAKRIAIGLASRALRGRGMQCKVARGLGMLDGRYAKSPLIDGRHPLAGRRIDDLVLPDGTRINQRRAGRAVLVAVGDADVGGLDVIALPQAPKRWCVKPPAVLIVRPDGVIAAVVEKPNRARIEAAWQRAFAGQRLDDYVSIRSSIETL